MWEASIYLELRFVCGYISAFRGQFVWGADAISWRNNAGGEVNDLKRFIIAAAILDIFLVNKQSCSPTLEMEHNSIKSANFFVEGIIVTYHVMMESDCGEVPASRGILLEPVEV